MKAARFLLAALSGAIVAASLMSAAQAVERKPLIFLCDKNYPPITYQEKGRPKGVAIDILRALEQRIGQPIDIRLTEWKEAQTLVAQGKADALCPLSITEHRKLLYDFSDPIMTLRFSIFTRVGGESFSDLADLRGRRVGVTAGGFPRTLLEADPQINMAVVNDYQQGFQMLTDGKLDAIIGDQWVGRYLLAEGRITDVQANDDAITRLASSIAVKKGDAALLAAINEGLRSLKADGSLARIYAAWQPKEVIFETREQAQRKIYYGALGIFGLLSVVVGIWIVSMKREIGERKRSEILAERERIRLETILKTASDGIHIMDVNGLLVEANDAFLNMLGYDNSAIGKLRVADWDAQDSWETIKKRNEHLIVRRTPMVFEARHRRSDGMVLDVEISASGIEIEGKLYIYAASRDITKRKQAELQLRIAAIAFESQQGMYITDAANVILSVNHAFTSITGYSSEEAIGQTPKLFRSGRHDAAFYAEIQESMQRSGTWKGELWNRRRNGEVYPEWLTITAVRDDAGTITNYVATLADVTSRKATEDEIKNLAFYDPLTGLPNRRLLLDRLGQALASSSRHQHGGALLFIDLDNFKVLNDTLGHDQGDLLLQLVARRLSSCVRVGDTVARLGGDEFVVMLEDLSETAEEAASQAETLAEKILATLRQTYKLVAYEHHSTASVGITLFADHSETIEDLLKRADLAMYQAKAAGRDTLRFFDPAMQAVIKIRAALEADIREALLKNQFVLYFQAQVMDENKLMGAEVLVRWQHPQRGIVPPVEFIPLAEDTGLILPLGLWVLETACAQLAIWAAQPEMAHLTLSVNVSARQFHQSNFVDQVLAVLAFSGANPHRLKLELTESMLVSDVEDIIAKMTALKAKGVGFSLDDFGTGYSSLSFLKLLPLDQLKIDQGFVRDILVDANDASIAKMVIALGDSLGLVVIAEGVEIEAQRDVLDSMGCHFFQGYLFSRPVPLEAFEEFAQYVKLA